LKLHRVLVALFLILGAVWVLFRASTLYRKEGFGQGFLQTEQFLIRRNQDIYDEFYVQYYDRLYRTRDTSKYIFDAVERLTQSSPEKSVILDVGCGAGEMIQYIQRTKGYKHVYGLDQSKAAIHTAKAAGLPVIQGDATTPMTFDKHTFTHIFVTGLTIYEFKDKVELLRNLYYWLMPNAYLIVQLVDRDRFDTIPPGAKPALLPPTAARIGDVRVTDAHVDFIDFVYESSFDLSNMSRNGSVVAKETFTDADTRKVRINERTLYVDALQDMVYTAQYAGFIVHGQFDLGEPIGDAYQHIFVLERPH
jgi:SAM-dependent methyltransferase